MKKHVTYIHYFTVFNDDIDVRTGPVSVVPSANDVIVIQDKKHQNRFFVVERVVWAVGKLATEAQVRLLPYTAV